MTTRGASRRLGLLTTTLTEVLLLLFFIVLMLGLRIHADDRASISKRADEAALAKVLLADTTEKLVLAEAELEVARAALETSKEWPEDFKRLVRQTVTSRAENHLVEAAVSTKSENTILRSQLTHEESQLAAEREARQALAAALERSHGMDRSAQLQQIAAEAAKAKTEVSRLTAAAAQTAREVETLRREAGNRTAQMKFVQAQLARAGNGMDHPPCWVDEAGRIEYLLRAQVREGQIGVEPLWPQRREADAQALPGLRDLVELREMRPPSFVQAAAPILEWSKRQDPQCRHFVWIKDVAESKNAFKGGLLAIESAFYKYLER